MFAGGHLRAYLFDEVQKLYTDRRQGSSDFWQWIKACQSQEGDPIHTLIIMAAAYGDTRSDFRGGSGPESPIGTPLDLADEQLVSLAPATATTGSLQLTIAEWQELWGGFLSQTRLPLGLDVQGFIWSICGGQVRCRTVDHDFVCMQPLEPVGSCNVLVAAGCLCWMRLCAEAGL